MYVIITGVYDSEEVKINWSSWRDKTNLQNQQSKKSVSVRSRWVSMRQLPEQGGIFRCVLEVEDVWIVRMERALVPDWENTVDWKLKFIQQNTYYTLGTLSHTI